MKLTFLGTRSSSEQKSSRHQRHSSLLVEAGEERVLIDCGSDWTGQLAAHRPTSILLSHAHDDHSGGLQAPYPCPVYAGQACWETLKEHGLPAGKVLDEKLSLVFNTLTIRAFAVDHSLRAPAFGLRLDAHGQSCIYLPDVAALPRPRDILHGVDLYIGDGSSFNSSLERMEEGVRCGHATIPRQLVWATQCKIKKILFTHCGSAVMDDELRAGRMLRGLAGKYGIEAAFAWDGMELQLGEG